MQADRIRGSGRPPAFLASVLGLALLAGCTGSPAEGDRPRPGASRSPVAAPEGPLLARPAAEGREERNPTVRVLRGLIGGTPRGERIRIVGNSFSFVPVAEDLVDAHERGVDVQVLLDEGASGDWKAPAVLEEGLGDDPDASSFVRLTRGRVHQKVWSFTRTGSSRDVVLVGSMNLTYHSARQYTDVYSFVGHRDVRRLFDRRFEELARSLPRVPPMSSAAVPGGRVWFHPGHDLSTDPVRRMLTAVPAQGARIRVVMYAWLDERGLLLAELLAAKDAAGADVEVVLGRSTGPAVRQLLEASGVEVHPGVFADGDDIHHKLALVSHPLPDGGRRRYVLTGSDNWTTKSLDRPEVLLRLDGSRGRTFARYDAWVDALVRRGRHERN